MSQHCFWQRHYNQPDSLRKFTQPQGGNFETATLDADVNYCLAKQLLDKSATIGAKGVSALTRVCFRPGSSPGNSNRRTFTSQLWSPAWEIEEDGFYRNLQTWRWCFPQIAIVRPQNQMLILYFCRVALRRPTLAWIVDRLWSRYKVVQYNVRSWCQR